MTVSQHSDLADRVEDSVRAYVLQKMPPDPSGELATTPFRELLHIYGSWRGRHPYPRPRAVHRSQEHLSSAEARTFQAEIDELVRKMEAGEDLKPHLSRAVDTAFLSTRSAPRFLGPSASETSTGCLPTVASTTCTSPTRSSRMDS